MKNDLLVNHWGFYTKPTLITRKNDLKKRWLVQFYFADSDPELNPKKLPPRKLPPVQRSGGINYSKTVSERTKEGNALKQMFIEDLAAGWHPWLDKYPEGSVHNVALQELAVLQPFEAWRLKSVETALEDSFTEATSLSAGTKRLYSYALDYFLEAMYAIGMQEIKMTDLKKSTVIAILNARKEIRGYSDKQHNITMSYIKALFTKAFEMCELPSVAEGIKPVKTLKKVPFKAPTDEEKVLIRQHLELEHRNYYRFVMFVYHVGLRPFEVHALQIRDIDRINKRIRIEPEVGRDNSKTTEPRYFAITPHLWALIEELELHKFPDDYYVCGGKPGHGRNDHHSKMFLPSAYRLQDDYGSRVWKRLVKDPVDKGGLGLKCDLYGNKSKGSSDKRKAGIPREAVQMMFGHTKGETTDIYTNASIYDDAFTKLSPDYT